MLLVWAAAGGACGAALRYLLVASLPGLFPWVTLGINIAGSLVIGLVWGYYAEAAWFQTWGRVFWVVGVLGGFTTFSTFSYDVVTLIEQQQLVLALGYILLSVLCCIGAAYLGWTLAKLN